MKKYTILPTLFFLIISSTARAQNCDTDFTGLVPINDLADSNFMGYSGGLYPNSNTKPDSHVQILKENIREIKPLDLNGEVDSISGKIVLLSIGASNPKTEFDEFMKVAHDFDELNEYLEIINGCKGGNGLQKIINTSSNYWTFVTNQLRKNAIHPKQVQVIWLEEENTQNNDISFPSAPLSLMEDFKILFQILVDFYPNLKVCYLNGRGYAGYVDSLSSAGNGLRAPRDYYHGWAMKWLIENQINGDTTLTYSGPNPKAPLLDWSAYLWADGENKRSDGLSWECPEDLKPNDGLHWSHTGNMKAGQRIFNQFTTDPQAILWFTSTHKTLTPVQQADVLDYVTISPNPTSGQFRIDMEPNVQVAVKIYNLSGQIVVFIKDYTPGSDLDVTSLSNGIYILTIEFLPGYRYISRISVIN